LRDATFAVRAGEVLALAGDNGAGKSTIVKILSGTVRPDRGTIRFAGRPVTITQPSDATALGIQTVYQDLALCDNLGVVANIFLGRELRRRFGLRLEMAAMERQATAILDSVGVKVPDIHSPVASLSGGQRQGAAVCRAVLGDPKVIILDEPTAALGVRQTTEILALIGRLKEQGRAVIVISHDLPGLLRIADRIVVLRLGETVADEVASTWSEHSLVSAITGASGARASAGSTP
jgi:D-xylose transport system ATP-binding protein